MPTRFGAGCSGMAGRFRRAAILGRMSWDFRLGQAGIIPEIEPKKS
jgi:hypothetical protein